MLWSIVAYIVSLPKVADWLINRSLKTPYSHLIDGTNGSLTVGPDYPLTKFTNLYMGRWWLFNHYDYATGKTKYSWFPWSIRVHKIARHDLDKHEHDHPWDYSRSIIIKGKGYWERRGKIIHWRRIGDTFRLDHGIFHRIEHVSAGGVWTIFITKARISDWGFLVNNKKVPHKKYFEMVRNKEV